MRCDGLAEKPGMAAAGARFLEREGLDGRVNSISRFQGVVGRAGCRKELLETCSMVEGWPCGARGSNWLLGRLSRLRDVCVVRSMQMT